MIRYGLHPEALLDLEEIHDYIAKDSPTGARRVIEEIFAKIERAVDFPEMGQFNHDLTSRSIRFLHVSDYLIAYVKHQRSLWGDRSGSRKAESACSCCNLQSSPIKLTPPAYPPDSDRSPPLAPAYRSPPAACRRESS